MKEKIIELYKKTMLQVKQLVDDVPYGRKLLICLGGVACFLIGVAVGRGCSSSHRSGSFVESPSINVEQAMDSLMNILPKGSQVVARFKDDRHALYYLNSGHLMKFNAKMKMLEEVELDRLDPELQVYYDEMADEQGILSAQLDDDKRFIILRVVTEPAESPDKEAKKALYALDTETMRIQPYSEKKKAVEAPAPVVQQRPSAPKEEKPEEMPTDVLYEGPAGETPPEAGSTGSTPPPPPPPPPASQGHGVEETLIAPPPPPPPAE